MRGLLRAMALEGVLLARAARGRDLVFYKRREPKPPAAQPGLPQTPASGAAKPSRRNPVRIPLRTKPLTPAICRRWNNSSGDPPPPDRPNHRRHLPGPRHLPQPV